MRKKEYLSELKDRIQQLEQEKEQLTKENLAHQMNNKTTSAVDPAVVAGLNGKPICFFVLFYFVLFFLSFLTWPIEVARVLAELDNALKINTEDRVVEYYLQTFFVAAGKLHNAFLKDVDEVVNPFTQVSLGTPPLFFSQCFFTYVSLASLGYMTSMDYPEISTTLVGGWWDSFIATSNLTPDQTSKLQEVISKLCKRDAELRMVCLHSRISLIHIG
jgi:hypothetical protein